MRLEPLQQYAKSWVNARPALSIEQISLHSQALGQADVELKLLSFLKYVLVFEISNCQHVDFSNLDTNPTSDDDQCVRSLKEIKYMDQFENQQVGQNWHRLFNSRFPGAVTNSHQVRVFIENGGPF